MGSSIDEVDRNPADEPPRSPADHPSERAQDRGFWPTVWKHKLYRDVLLVTLGFLMWQGFAAIQSGRVEGTKNSCESFNAAAGSVNKLIGVTQGIILSGAALPGDTPGPQNVNPEEWKTLSPGALSRQLESQYPDFPTSQERLKRAQKNTEQLETAEVELRNCEEEVKAVKGSE